MFFSNKYDKLNLKRPEVPESSVTIVRPMCRYDLSQILILALELRELAGHSHRRPDREFTLNNFKKNLVKAITGNGIALVSENCNGFSGFIAGVCVENIWSDDAIVLSEFGFYSRNKRAGYLLLHSYLAKCVELKEKGVIQLYTMGEIKGVSPDYSKFGMSPTETTWVA